LQVYKITNLINGKIYIGQDSHDNPKYLGSGVLIKRAIKKYGKENFQKEIINQCNSKKEMDQLEIYWINYYNTFSPKGYNIHVGGTGGDTFSNNPNKEHYIFYSPCGIRHDVVGNLRQFCKDQKIQSFLRYGIYQGINEYKGWRVILSK